MNVPFFDLKRQYKNIKSEIDKAVEGIFERTEFVQGKTTEEFEKEFAAYNGVKYCACVSNGTTALHLALLSLRVGLNNEVIVPANTFIATAEAVSHCGAIPVFVDINEDYTINTDLISQYIGCETQAIIPVHLYGCPSDMYEINKIASKYKISILEDCAQAHGATINNQKIGSFGDVGAFSFYPSKNLGACGEGGAVLTNTEETYIKIKQLRDHGSLKKYEHDIVGYNYRISGVQSSTLLVKLKYLDKWNNRRKEIAKRYIEKLKDLPIKLPKTSKDCVYHLFVVQVDNRDKLIETFKENNIGYGLHYPTPLHLTKAYQHLGYKVGDFPVAENYAKKIISLPMFPELTDEEVDFVCTIIKNEYNS